MIPGACQLGVSLERGAVLLQLVQAQLQEGCCPPHALRWVGLHTCQLPGQSILLYAPVLVRDVARTAGLLRAMLLVVICMPSGQKFVTSTQLVLQLSMLLHTHSTGASLTCTCGADKALDARVCDSRRYVQAGQQPSGQGRVRAMPKLGS